MDAHAMDNARTRANARRGEGDGPRGVLQTMLAERVIPELVQKARATRAAPDDDMRDRLLRMVLRDDLEGARALVRDGIVRGIRAPVLCDKLLGPVANALGLAWEKDECDFVAVSFGIRFLDELLQEIREIETPRPSLRRGRRPAILLAPVPEEQHVFGLKFVADSFERAGWATTLAEGGGADALLHQVAAARYDIVGLSVSADRNLEKVRKIVQALKRRSLRPGLAVLLGGSAVLRHPETGTRAGADAVAVDARNAVATAEVLVSKASVSASTSGTTGR
ncbi:MAG: cobalamin-dependent protein [Pseudomonadota bacterium]